MILCTTFSMKTSLLDRALDSTGVLWHKSKRYGLELSLYHLSPSLNEAKKEEISANNGDAFNES